MLRFEYSLHGESPANGAASMSGGKLRSLEMEMLPDSIEAMCRGGIRDLTEYDISTISKLLVASRTTLEELRLGNCTKNLIRAVFAIGMQRLRKLTVDVVKDLPASPIMPWQPYTAPETAALAFVTHLEVTLENEWYLGLVSCVGGQLTSLVLSVRKKNLLQQCLNLLHLPALRTLTVREAAWKRYGDIMQKEDLGSGCWRIMAQLEMLHCECYLLYRVLPEMLQHCKNLKRLALVACGLPIEQINALKELKELHLRPYFNSKTCRDVRTPLLCLPQLEHLHIASHPNICLSTQWPRLTSLVIENCMPISSASIMCQVRTIHGIKEKRFSKFTLNQVRLDCQDIVWLMSLLVDDLYLKGCELDATLDNALEKTGNQCRVARTVMESCVIIGTSTDTLQFISSNCSQLLVTRLDQNLRNASVSYLKLK